MAEEETKETKKAPAKSSAAKSSAKTTTKSAETKKAAPKKTSTAKKTTTTAKKPAAKKTASGKTVTITQIASGAGRQKDQQQTLVGLGLNKMHRTSTLKDTPAVRGMINKVQHLVKIEEAA